MVTDYLTTQEAAEALHTTAQTIRNYLKAGKLPAAKLPSGVYRVPRWALQQVLETSKAVKS